jgi:hypothetical protein
VKNAKSFILDFANYKGPTTKKWTLRLPHFLQKYGQIDQYGKGFGWGCIAYLCFYPVVFDKVGIE